MSDAVGIELAPDAVRVATATAAGPSGDPVEWVPPALFVEGRDQFLHGTAALEAGAARPRGLITDVVGQFTVDRLFLTEGQMLTPDAVLHGLLGGIVGSISQRRGAAPLAITVSCPATWDDLACGRVRQIVEALRLPSCQIVRGLDAPAAAADAATRLPQASAERDATGLGPDLQSGLRRAATHQATVADVDPRRTEIRSNRVGLIVTAVVLAAVAGLIGYLVVDSGDEPSVVATGGGSGTTLPTGTSSAVPASSTTPPPARPMVLGVFSAAASEPEILAAVQVINDAGGVFDQPVLVVVEAPGTDPAAVIGQMLRQGVTTVVANVSAQQLDAALGAADRLAVCSTGTDPTTSADAVVVVSSPTVCVETLALAAQSAGLADAGIIAESLGEMVPSSTGAAGVPCSTYAQCRNLVAANQQVVYSPPGTAIRRSTAT